VIIDIVSVIRKEGVGRRNERSGKARESLMEVFIRLKFNIAVAFGEGVPVNRYSHRIA
jgi:hypothetical protein